jgi:D-amino-acid oxidase
MFPPILGHSGQFDVIRDIVGRRPARNGGLRLEYENPRADDLYGRRIVHAYGAAGSGYAISWGVAYEVARMVMATTGPGSVHVPAQL